MADYSPPSSPNRKHRRLECPVCWSIYTDPRALQCGHSMCFRCIPDENPIACAVCRRVSRGSREQLPVIYALRDVIESLRYACTVCTSRDDSLKRLWYCRSCDTEMICSTCLIKHHRNIREHDLQPMDAVLQERKNQLRETVEDTESISAGMERVRNEITKLEETAKQMWLMLHLTIKPTFVRAISEVNTQLSALLANTEDLSEANLLNGEHVRAILEEAPETMNDLKRTKEELETKVAALRVVMEKAKATIGDMMLDAMGNPMNGGARNPSIVQFEISDVMLQPGEQRRSEAHTSVQGLRWYVSIKRKVATDEEEEKVSLFLHCTRALQRGDWSAGVTAAVRILSQADGVEERSRNVWYIFSHVMSQWGCNIMPWTDLVEEANRYVVENNKIVVEVEIKEVIDICTNTSLDAVRT